MGLMKVYEGGKPPSLKEALRSLFLTLGFIWNFHILPSVAKALAKGSKIMAKGAVQPQTALVYIAVSILIIYLYMHTQMQQQVIENLVKLKQVSPDTIVLKSAKSTIEWGTKNEAAPVSSKYLNATLVNDYVNRYSAVAITEMQKFGVPASISLAQGLIESRAGTSKLAKRNQNHFGIKCFSRHCKKGHCSNFTDDTHKDFFRAFKNPWESWREHSRMISSGRYAKLKHHGRDYRKWAYGLKSLGYATDRTYADKLIGIIEKYQLYKYDR